MQVYFIISCSIILYHGLDLVDYLMYVLCFLCLTLDLLSTLIFYELFLLRLGYRSLDCIFLVHCKNCSSSAIEVLILMSNFNLDAVLFICCTLLYGVISILLLFSSGRTCFSFSMSIAMQFIGWIGAGLFTVFGRLLLGLLLIVLRLIFEFIRLIMCNLINEKISQMRAPLLAFKVSVLSLVGSISISHSYKLLILALV